MKKPTLEYWISSGIAGIVFLGVLVSPALSHHSFAMYDQTVEKTMTGKLTRFIPGSNHAQLIFDLVEPDGTSVVGEDGNPLRWGVETGSAAALARQGVTVKSFPLGTIITVTLHPLRDGRPFGAMTGGTGRLIYCGMAMPEGGCTAVTGQVFLAD